MKVIKQTLVAVATLVLTLTGLTSQAGTGNGSGIEGSRRIELKESVVLSGVMIKPGAYVLSWSRVNGSDDVRISVARGKNVLATAAGRWIASAQPSPYEALVYQTARGANELAGILFEHSTESIRIDDDATRAESGQPTGTDTH